MNTKEKCFLPTRKEISYLDSHDKPCEKKNAFRIIVKEYDIHGKLIKCLMSIDPSKGKLQ